MFWQHGGKYAGLTPGRASVLGPDTEEVLGRGVCPRPEHKKLLPKTLPWRPNPGIRRGDAVEEKNEEEGLG